MPTAQGGLRFPSLHPPSSPPEQHKSTGAHRNPLRAPPFHSQSRLRSPGGQRQPQPRPRLPPWARPRRRRSRLSEGSRRQRGKSRRRAGGGRGRDALAVQEAQQREVQPVGAEEEVRVPAAVPRAPSPRLASAGCSHPTRCCGLWGSPEHPSCEHPRMWAPRGISTPRLGCPRLQIPSEQGLGVPKCRLPPGEGSPRFGPPRCEHPPVPSPEYGMAFLGWM